MQGLEKMSFFLGSFVSLLDFLLVAFSYLTALFDGNSFQLSGLSLDSKVLLENLTNLPITRRLEPKMRLKTPVQFSH